MRTRNCRDSLFREFERRYSLVAAYGREGLEKLLKRIACFEVVEKVLHRHASTDEHRLSAHDFRVGVHHLLFQLAHLVILSPEGIVRSNCR